MQEEPWSPPDVSKTEHSLGQNIWPSSSTQEATELKRREWVASAPKRGQVTASWAATDVRATGSGVLSAWKMGTSGNAREATSVTGTAFDGILVEKAEVGVPQHEVTDASATKSGVLRLGRRTQQVWRLELSVMRWRRPTDSGPGSRTWASCIRKQEALVCVTRAAVLPPAAVRQERNAFTAEKA